MSIIVDTTVWIDYLGDHPTPQVQWLHREMSRSRLGITDLTLCEVLQGIRQQELYELTREMLLKYIVHNTGGAQLAISASQNYRVLRSKGYTIRTSIDCLIATFCIQNGFSLLHSDHDFDPFEQLLGLQVIHPEP